MAGHCGSFSQAAFTGARLSSKLWYSVQALSHSRAHVTPLAAHRPTRRPTHRAQRGVLHRIG
eukprot:CAMPEP_0171247790 /NCGR_PEP_ID=MMETSP0790-20130122/48678_1 /TAXON_ID=2925 /ORGANISM="Alexandrium catenella, Strain OF101" /LENGTH=61 /DNA_ID=CAMNT_0011715213 /DNA_START=150 /DNA_END=332 /DNA_ORIENTATION=-